MPPELTRLTKVDPARIAAIARASEEKLGALGLATSNDPLSLFEFFYDEWYNLVVRPGKQVSDWITSVSSSMMVGRPYTPTMHYQDAVAFRAWCDNNSAIYNLLIQLSPAFKTMDVQARMSLEASRYPGNTIPPDKVLIDLKQHLDSLPSVLDAAKSFPQVASDAAGALSKMVHDIWDVLLQILRILQEMWPELQYMWQVMRDSMKPAFDMLNEQILQPYRKIAEDGKVAFEQYRSMVEKQGRGVDAAVPPIVGPNIDEYVKLLPVLAKYFSLPIVGSVARAELQTMSMVDYQAVQQRGFATPLRAAEYAAGMVAPAGPGQLLMDATKPPSWFLSNI